MHQSMPLWWPALKNYTYRVPFRPEVPIYIQNIPSTLIYLLTRVLQNWCHLVSVSLCVCVCFIKCRSSALPVSVSLTMPVSLSVSSWVRPTSLWSVCASLLCVLFLIVLGIGFGIRVGIGMRIGRMHGNWPITCSGTGRKRSAPLYCHAQNHAHWTFHHRHGRSRDSSAACWWQEKILNGMLGMGCWTSQRLSWQRSLQWWDTFLMLLSKVSTIKLTLILVYNFSFHKILIFFVDGLNYVYTFNK